MRKDGLNISDRLRKLIRIVHVHFAGDILAEYYIGVLSCLPFAWLVGRVSVQGSGLRVKNPILTFAGHLTPAPLFSPKDV